jgi:signal transduction histidine kinase
MFFKKYSDMTIEIKDNGSGIPKNDLKIPFRPFFRASNILDICRSGLGKAITKEYIELNLGILNKR